MIRKMDTQKISSKNKEVRKNKHEEGKEGMRG
jgi:hypothetical protein